MLAHTPLQLKNEVAGQWLTAAPVHPIFYDASRRRRRWFNAVALAVATLVLIATVFFAASVLTPPELPHRPLPRTAVTRAVSNTAQVANPAPALAAAQPSDE
jgi:hypothetical protein